ncbi:MAG: FAD:protein FMN transferase [Deltaproteobacteria bacterium]|nr:FAD:protein FMN transferase [Deltaproteobacteria bacterium]
MRVFSFKAMGSPCEIRIYGDERADAIAAAAQAEVVRLEAKYSRYREDSLASRINRSAGDARGVEVDGETARLLDYAATAWRESEGRFDVTSGILRRAWNFKSGRVPEQREIDALLPLIGWDQVVWHAPRIVLPRAGMEIDFGGYVKEYAADLAAAKCRELGARHGLVDLGGDLAVIGPHPSGVPWRIGVRDPRAPERALAFVALSGGGLATSGDYERCIVANGTRYGHVLDPRTGWPTRGLASVTTAAPACLVAGTLTTSAMLRGERGGAWLDALGASSLWVRDDGQLGGRLAPRASSAPTHSHATPARI